MSRILVVEDEPAIADFLQRGLTSEGYSVSTAADGNDAGHTGCALLELLPECAYLIRIRIACARQTNLHGNRTLRIVTGIDALQTQEAVQQQTRAEEQR